MFQQNFCGGKTMQPIIKTNLGHKSKYKATIALSINKDKICYKFSNESQQHKKWAKEKRMEKKKKKVEGKKNAREYSWANEEQKSKGFLALRLFTTATYTNTSDGKQQNKSK